MLDATKHPRIPCASSRRSDARTQTRPSHVRRNIPVAVKLQEFPQRIVGVMVQRGAPVKPGTAAPLPGAASISLFDPSCHSGKDMRLPARHFYPGSWSYGSVTDADSGFIMFHPLSAMSVYTSGRYVFINLESILLQIRDFNIIANNTWIAAKTMEKQMRKLCIFKLAISRFYRQEKRRECDVTSKWSIDIQEQ